MNQITSAAGFPFIASAQEQGDPQGIYIWLRQGGMPPWIKKPVATGGFGPPSISGQPDSLVLAIAAVDASNLYYWWAEDFAAGWTPGDRRDWGL